MYWRSGRGIVAINRVTGREAWLLATLRFPYLNRIIEAGSNVVLVQIGTDVPVVLRGAIETDRHPVPLLGVNDPARRATPAWLLREYGDG